MPVHSRRVRVCAIEPKLIRLIQEPLAGRYPHKDMKECVQLAVGCFGKERVMWGTGCMFQSCFRAHQTPTACFFLNGRILCASAVQIQTRLIASPLAGPHSRTSSRLLECASRRFATVGRKLGQFPHHFRALIDTACVRMQHAWGLSHDEVEWYLGKTAQKLFFPKGSGAIKSLHRSMI